MTVVPASRLENRHAEPLQTVRPWGGALVMKDLPPEQHRPAWGWISRPGPGFFFALMPRFFSQVPGRL